uniref:ATP synthase complex subunit 8 n=1 Tax=Hydrelia parvulata TaxID=2507166 RepID=A0A6M3W1M6_9NEOP|nr:ATP synthase F0 subunit 8 [Hydrelia parvulata]
MPQMMPINWLISFILFVLIFLIFNIMNYYIMNTNFLTKNIINKTSKKNFNWKW